MRQSVAGQIASADCQLVVLNAIFVGNMVYPTKCCDDRKLATCSTLLFDVIGMCKKLDAMVLTIVQFHCTPKRRDKE